MLVLRIMVSCLIAVSTLSCMAQNRKGMAGIAEVDNRIIGQEQAIEKAVVYSAFTDQAYSVAKGNVDVSMITPDVADCPLVRNGNYGHSIWKVKLNSVKNAQIGEDKATNDIRSRDFTFWIDAVSGKLLRVYSGLPDTTISKISRRPFYTYKERMKDESAERDSNIIFYDFPDSLYNMTFYEALKATIDNPFEKGEITAYYVNAAWYSEESRPLWIIDVSGIPPQPEGGSSDDWNINHLEKVFDARIGPGGMIVAIYYTAQDWWRKESLIESNGH